MKLGILGAGGIASTMAKTVAGMKVPQVCTIDSIQLFAS